MWQYCHFCEKYYYKFGNLCPNCYTFSLWMNPIPDAETKTRLNAIASNRDCVSKNELEEKANVEIEMHV